jgi:hypothetical protein
MQQLCLLPGTAKLNLIPEVQEHKGAACCTCRPVHVQIADIVVTSVHQSGAKYIARPLSSQSGDSGAASTK